MTILFSHKIKNIGASYVSVSQRIYVTELLSNIYVTTSIRVYNIFSLDF